MHQDVGDEKNREHSKFPAVRKGMQATGSVHPEDLKGGSRKDLERPRSQISKHPHA